MRRIISITGAAALVMLAACQKEESTASKVALTATLEQQVDNGATKTALNPTNNVIWSAGDQIKVNTTDGLETLTLTAGQGTTTGKFGSTTGDDPDYAIYPASACTSLSGSTFTFTLPATQTYAENSFANGANVAVAAISGSTMAFKNVCGVLKLQLKGSMKVKTIELTGKSGEKLSGAFTVNAAASPFVGAVKTTGDPTDAEKKVTLDCSHFGETSEGAADGGVTLSLATPIVFDIIVPVSAFADGFEAKIITTDVFGETFCVALETAEDNTIARSTITRMPSKAVSLLPEGYQEVEYIEAMGSTSGTEISESGPFINTGICPTNSTGWGIHFQPGNDMGDHFLNGAYDTVKRLRFTVGNDGRGPYAGYGGYWFYSGYFPKPGVVSWITVRMNFKNDKKLTSSAGSEFTNDLPQQVFSVNHPLYIGGCCFGDGENITRYSCWPQKIGIVIVTNEENVVGYFVPCEDSEGTVGMYDAQRHCFKTNEGGTGSFIAGLELTD